MACIQGMRDVVALLISKGADSKIVDSEGKSCKILTILFYVFIKLYFSNKSMFMQIFSDILNLSL